MNDKIWFFPCFHVWPTLNRKKWRQWRPPFWAINTHIHTNYKENAPINLSADSCKYTEEENNLNSMMRVNPQQNLTSFPSEIFHICYRKKNFNVCVEISNRFHRGVNWQFNKCKKFYLQVNHPFVHIIFHVHEIKIVQARYRVAHFSKSMHKTSALECTLKNINVKSLG